MLESWKETTATVVQAEFAIAPDQPSRMAAIWRNVSQPPDELGDHWLLLEHELWLRAVRDPDVGAGLRIVMRRCGPRWPMDSASAGCHAAVGPHLASQVFAMLIGLDMQRRLDPDAVTDETAIAGLNALFGAAEAPGGSRTVQ